jgi:hypothetical protein
MLKVTNRNLGDIKTALSKFEDNREVNMAIKGEFNKLVEKLKTQRDEINLKIHLASMNAKNEFAEAEKKWAQVKTKAADIADDAVETSEEVIAKTKMVGEELKETYKRISKRLSE